MTCYIHRSIVEGNILLGRYDSSDKQVIPISEIEKDESLLLELLAKSDFFVRHTARDDFCDNYPFIAKIGAGVNGEDALQIKAPKNRIERYFYLGLPPALQKIFDSFYPENHKFTSQQ